MVTPQLGAVVRHIRTLAAARSDIEQTDGALLRAFLSDNNQPAFEVLVRRHGPMVLRVCRRTLGNLHDAEDALQATFLVLAQKAASIRKHESLASWLHGVAYRMATDARKAAARRHARESRARAAQPHDPALTAAWQEIQALLDEEIGRLPETLRAPFILCCLERKSNAEAARQLGLQEATVGMRLSRARKLLQQRLIRRGVSLTMVLAAIGAGSESAAAAVPISLAVSIAQAAAGVAAGQAAGGLVSAKVAVLTEGVLKAMFLTKLKTIAVVLLAVALAGTGTGALTYHTLAAGQPDGETATPASQTQKASDAAQVPKLIDKLGSDRFAEREKATKELDRIGAPALDALRKAAQSDDPERKRRAEELVEEIESRALAADLLAPKRVHLAYKDTPLAEAVADFRKQSGYELRLSDPKGKLKDQTITLDTGDVTFWKALDAFCHIADLVASAPPPERRTTPIRTQSPLHRMAQLPAAGPIGAGAGAFVLSEGKPLALPTDDGTSVRVRARRPSDGLGKPDEGEVLLVLEITPEPRLYLQHIVAVHVKKAIDDQGQQLQQVLPGGPAPTGRGVTGLAAAPGGVAPHRPAGNAQGGATSPQDAGTGFTPVRLKKGARAARSLASISGTITIRVAVKGESGNKSVTVDVPFTLTNVLLP